MSLFFSTILGDGWSGWGNRFDVSDMTITNGGDEVEDGMGTPLALVHEEHVIEDVLVDVPRDVV